MADNIKIISENRKARFNYHIIDRFEAGMMLTGSEVKSLRAGHASLGDAYGVIKNGGVYLLNAHISPYQPARHANHEPLRQRKLLLHAHEIKKLIGQTQEKGYTLVPLKLYFKDGLAKLELALGKSKKTGDKRETIKKRESDRDVRRVLKQSKR